MERKYRLGKLSPSRKASVRLTPFLTTLPTTPLIDTPVKMAYGMDKNDLWGDCVAAGTDHLQKTVRKLLTGKAKDMTTTQLLQLYKTQNPDFNPKGSESTNGPGSNADGGMDEQTLLNYLTNQKEILGFAAIEGSNQQELQAAIYLGLSVMIGVNLQQAQEDQFDSGLWDYVDGSPIVGGHCVDLIGYDSSTDTYDLITWGKTIKCTADFLRHQMDECWFVLMPEHVAHPQFRNHFDLAGFSQAVNEITEGKVVIPV